MNILADYINDVLDESENGDSSKPPNDWESGITFTARTSGMYKINIPRNNLKYVNYNLHTSKQYFKVFCNSFILYLYVYKFYIYMYAYLCVIYIAYY